MSDESPIMFRRAGRNDIRFITNSWLKSFRDGLTARAIPNDIYYYQQHRVIEKLLEKSLNVVVCNTDNPDQILAWACVERHDKGITFHYVYVKGPFRKMGLATKMVEEIINSENADQVFMSHRTYFIKQMRDKWKGRGGEDKLRDFTYNPFLQWKEVTL